MRNDILIIGNFLSEHRYSRGVCEDLALRLQLAGWSVITASNKVSRFSRLKDIINTIWKYRHNYSVAQVDVFSRNAFFLSETACLLLRKVGKPYILTLHGGGLPDFAKLWPTRVKWLLNSAVAVTVPSEYLLKTMSQYRRDLTLIPNGIHLPSCQFRDRGNLLPKIIWVRAFSHIYNPLLAIRVAAILLDKLRDMTLTMIGADKGDGTMQAAIDLAIKLGLSDSIQIVGYVPRSAIPSWLDRNDIFINTTNVDNTPVSVVEAMACGLCTVNTNVGGLPYMLEHNINAILVPPNDPEAMADSILRLLHDPELSSRIASGGRSLATSFSWDIVLPQWNSLFHSILG